MPERIRQETRTTYRGSIRAVHEEHGPVTITGWTVLHVKGGMPYPVAICYVTRDAMLGCDERQSFDHFAIGRIRRETAEADRQEAQQDMKASAAWL